MDYFVFNFKRNTAHEYQTCQRAANLRADKISPELLGQSGSQQGWHHLCWQFVYLHDVKKLAKKGCVQVYLLFMFAFIKMKHIVWCPFIIILDVCVFCCQGSCYLLCEVFIKSQFLFTTNWRIARLWRRYCFGFENGGQT